MIKYLLIIFFVIFSVKSIASTSLLNTGFDYTLPAPPKTSNAQSLYSYLYNMYTNWGTIQVTTTEPNGNITADYGNICVYYNGTTYYLAIQTTAPSGTTWVGVALGAV